ncbi:MAG TPA: hypothetical protein VFD82_06515 [Planctomycetota bacterium]|nr:hypothetical protein [Planctomycetota bacterium]
MFHLTVFSATEGELAPARATVFTVFGSAELRGPTVAQQLLHFRAQQLRKPGRWDWLFRSEENLAVTIFGATTIHEPTIAEEYSALAGVVRAGRIAKEELPGLLDAFEAHIASRGALRTFTLFGACVVAPHKVATENKALQAAADSGAIDVRARKGLEGLIEAPRPVRWRAVGELVLAG